MGELIEHHFRNDSRKNHIRRLRGMLFVKFDGETIRRTAVDVVIPMRLPIGHRNREIQSPLLQLPLDEKKAIRDERRS